MKAVSVTELNNQIKSIIEAHFEIIYVEGEVSKVVYHSSGHLYFTLKDEKSSVNCAMWRSNISKLGFKLKEGEKVYVFGALSVYTPRGEYKIIAQNIEPVGAGAMQKAFEQLKEELYKLGYFDKSRKKPVPKFPKRIAIITSATGAALQDMLRIAKKRWLLSEFYLFNALVQGDGAAKDIAQKIRKADSFVFDNGKGFDLIIVGRGGGSKEDLWPFNEREVADAIFEAEIPVISAVGHEIDYLISDFVADVRAATPSNAMEIALPDKNEILMLIDEWKNTFYYKTLHVLQKKNKELSSLKELYSASSPLKKLDVLSEECEFTLKKLSHLFVSVLYMKNRDLEHLKTLFDSSSPLNKINEFEKELKFLKNVFDNKFSQILTSKEKELQNVKKAFETMNPEKRGKEGFAEILKNGKRTSLSDISEGDIFEIADIHTVITSKALKKSVK